ncbi:MAG TPA: hypothetical protein VE268_10950 [Herpetosiphonaceae bacterium]|jgi:hypothetical protein|nr:hypothetical protein [Herpetosiphonaceae bacterium]
MSDQPLFQNQDAQEKVYAPQERPEDEAQDMVEADEGARGSRRGTSAGGSATGSGGGSTGAGGTGTTAVPMPGPGGAGVTPGNASNLVSPPAVGVPETDDDNRS